MKKNQDGSIFFNKNQIRQVFLIMKLVSFMLFIGALSLSASSYSQKTKIDLNILNSNILDILNSIEKSSEFIFVYDAAYINSISNKSIDVKSKAITEILDELFQGTGVAYLIDDRQVFLYNSKDLSTLTSPEAILLMSQQLQRKEISGTVKDTKGLPLPGVTVVVKGTIIGSITDNGGKFKLSVPTDAKTLVFSFVGMKTQEIVIGNNTTISLTLAEEAVGIEEVVAVGYGTQKKMNLTGSVSNISSEALESKNVTKGSLALVGEMSGISVRQLSGNPMNNAAQITIRGLGTFSSAGNNPLIIVDGIESSIDNIDPNDIKSVSVLKDAASSSIYGSKAANGVILVETNRGTAGAIKINFYSYYGKQQASMIPQMADSWEYAIAMNEALVNQGQTARFADADIQKFKSGTDPAYPNFNHMKNLWTSGSGIQSKQGVSMSGGTSGTQYLFSASYLDQHGIVMKNFTKRYDMRLKVNTKLKDNINLSVNLSGNTSKGTEPSGAYQQGLSWIGHSALRLSNNIPDRTPDGYWGANETLHPEADLNSNSFNENKNSFLFGTADLVWDIFKNLKISGKIGYTYGILQNKWFRATYPVTSSYSVSPNFLSQKWSNSTALTLQSLIEYNKSFGNHSIHLLGGFSQQQYYDSYINARRDNFPNNELYEIDAGSVANATNGGGASENKLQSFFSRGNYSFLDKYLFEANIRYDGSSRFPKAHRFGLFPSVSAGWRVSNEDFFRKAVPWINNLKLRASWGELGNQSIGNYPYQSLISLGQNYPFGNTLSAGAAVITVPNINITWERTKMTDAGLDLSVMNNKLSFTADYFVKTTSDILYQVSASAMLGATPSTENAGTVENSGWDFDLSYKNTLGDFSYSISANYSIVNNKVLKLTNVKQDINRGLFVGRPIGSLYGFISDGIFVDQADVQSYATQPFTAAPGEIRYKDISGPNGVPDGKVDLTYDRTVIGSPIPTSTFGLNLTAKYKGFDLSLLFQGEGGRKNMISLPFFFPNDNNGNIQKWEYDLRWTPENPNPEAGFPRLLNRGENFFRNNPSSFWIKNASFLRLKNLQIGYNIPSKLTEKISIHNVRINISGENLFTLDNYYRGWDPEMGGTNAGWNGVWYPPTRLWLAGISIDF
jgi:TonB-linked SusC/RagA family outer membrane protein